MGLWNVSAASDEDPVAMLRPRRRIAGMSAVLLPFAPDGRVDWASFEQHVDRTLAAGLAPAVNMDTGYVALLDEATRNEVLTRTASAAASFVASAFVDDRPGEAFRPDAYRAAIDRVRERGGTPIIFPSYGLSGLEGARIGDAMAELGEHAGRFYAFELSPRFAPFGRVFDLSVYERLLALPTCVGAKHSSLSRAQEWARLRLRDRLRPEFSVLTGNDLAIDMVMYGSDYLLGLSTFAPAAFARRDRLWAEGDPAFYELNDALQALGAFTFRDPIPAYRHSAAQYLAAAGHIRSDRLPVGAPRRPDSDRAVLETLRARIEACSG